MRIDAAHGKKTKKTEVHKFSSFLFLWPDGGIGKLQPLKQLSLNSLMAWT